MCKVSRCKVHVKSKDQVDHRETECDSMINDLVHPNCIKELCEIPEDGAAVLPISGSDFKFKAASVGSIRC